MKTQRNLVRVKPPKELWVILDPFDGPHLFYTKKDADKTFKEWKDEDGDQFDSILEITGPFKFVYQPS